MLRNFSRMKAQNCRVRFNPSNRETANYYVPHADLNITVDKTTDHPFFKI